MDNSILQVENLSKSFGDILLFDSISFGLAENERVGIIAQNGAGKSTLLNIIMDKEAKDSGNIVFRRDIRIGYLPQTPVYSPDLSVFEACFEHGNETVNLIKEYEQCLQTEGNPGMDDLVIRMEHSGAWQYEQRIKQILSILRINNYNQKISHLSGGQLKCVALANALILDPNLLILDEPTNHLDLEMIEWLEKYLQQSNIALLMVTHDRYFLDRVCSSIIELDNKKLYSYKGNYTYYLEKREERLNANNVMMARANNLYRTELDWMSRMPKARGHKAQYRKDSFHELEEVVKQNNSEKKVQLKIKASYIGKKIFEATHLYKSFGEKKILDNFSYVFARFEKVGIVGDNGTGKSTFLKILMGQEQVDKGNLDIGETVRFGYYSQGGMKFDDQMKVIDAVTQIADYIDLGDGHKLTAQQLLLQFLFTPETQHNYIYKLSGGERRRLYLCTVLMENPNFLILDEPTNDLDILTLNVLEEYLLEFKGCLIVVSHDRYFMDKMVDHLLVFEGDGKIKDFPGNYSDYREWRDEKDKERVKQVKIDKPKNNKPQRSDSTPRLTYKEKIELKQLEQEISDMEAEKKEIETNLCSGNLKSDELVEKSKRLSEINDLLDEKSMRWLELSEKESQ